MRAPDDPESGKVEQVGYQSQEINERIHITFHVCVCIWWITCRMVWQCVAPDIQDAEGLCWHVTMWVYVSNKYVESWQVCRMSLANEHLAAEKAEDQFGSKLWLSMPSIGHSLKNVTDIGLPWAYHWQFQVAHWWWRVSLEWWTTTRPLRGTLDLSVYLTIYDFPRAWTISANCGLCNGIPCGCIIFLWKIADSASPMIATGNRMWGQKLRKVKETPSILARATDITFLCCNKIITKGITDVP